MISTDERSAINDLLARYCWHMDEGEGDAWAALWTDDGRFTGIPTPVDGREALRQMPPGFRDMADGKMRHSITNIVIDPGEDADTVSVKGYSMVSDWREGGKFIAFAKAHFTLVRQGGRWKIKSLHADMF